MKDVIICISCIVAIIVLIVVVVVLIHELKDDTVVIHKAFRTYSDDFYRTYMSLNDLFKEGWKVKSVSEPVECHDSNGTYLEYVLYKEVKKGRMDEYTIKSINKI